MPSVGKTHSRRTGGSNSGWTLDRVRVQKGLLALDERIGGLCACEMSALSTRIENDPYSGLGEQIGSRALRPHRAVGFGSARLDGGPELRLVVREDPVSLSCRFKSCSSWAWSSSRASTDCCRFSL